MYALLASLTLLASCEKEHVFNPNQDLPPRLFIRAQLDAQSGLDVLVTKAAIGVDTTYFKDLEVYNALVRIISEMGDTVVVPYTASSHYQLPSGILPVEAGKKYLVSVQVPGFETVQSDWVTMPLPILASHAVFVQVSGTPDDLFATGQGEVDFIDRPGSRDFYLLRFLGRQHGHPLQRMDYGISSVQICDLAHYEPIPDAVVRDDCFEGSDHAQLKLAGNLNIANDDYSGQVLPDELLIIFGSVSESYYHFIFSLVQPDGIENGFAEPKPTYSNIHGGLGVFYTSNTQTTIIPR